jgi:peptide-methionine (S)-S-oxide reductase
MNDNGQKTETATFGAGCFWGVEAAFREIPGVLEVTSGYSGGSVPNPSYEQVCTDRTGHAEVVEVRFDPAAGGYERLLDAFWEMHDPTQSNRQGHDVGRQYRSVIYYHSPEQRTAAETSKARLAASGRFKKPIATSIEPAAPFYLAEAYHQRYFEKHGGH